MSPNPPQLPIVRTSAFSVPADRENVLDEPVLEAFRDKRALVDIACADYIQTAVPDC
jgi:hypothetical protein